MPQKIINIIIIVLSMVLILMQCHMSSSLCITAQGLNIRKYIGLDSKEFETFKGNNITVVTIDSGISLHNDIPANRILFFKDFVSQKDYPYDDIGHGTSVAGIIGANGKMKGIAPEVNFVILKVLDKFGKTNSDILQSALEWVYENSAKYNIRIINLSIGINSHLNYKEDVICSLIEKLYNKGIITVCATGNYDESEINTTILSPANSPYAITVGSCKNNKTYSIVDDKLASFSIKGKQYESFSKPDLITHGVDILSLDYKNPEKYVLHSGTSLSCAIVTGTIAILCEKFSDETPVFIKEYLIKNSKILPNDNKLDQGYGQLSFYSSKYDILASIKNMFKNMSTRHIR